MKSNNLHDWLQIIGMAAIVASLIFVGLQLRQSEYDAIAEVNSTSLANGIELSSLSAEHADVWLRACAGEELNPPEQFIANNIFFRYLMFHFNSYLRDRETQIGGVPPTYYADVFAANIHRYPGFMKMSMARNAWAKLGVPSENTQTAEAFERDVVRRLRELAEEEPIPNAEVSWCGVQ